jgi:cellulose synthase/poly-beta-1,6-N-acetylglucosamine synthase-like glycosyltransferase
MTSLETMLAMLFWLSAAIVIFCYGVYPLAIGCLACCFGRRRRSALSSDAHLPSVSLLIAAYNEEAVIEGRLRNALDLDYPSDRLEIVVASDGSVDSTAEIVKRFA